MTLTTNYLGLLLKNPIVASSSPLSHNVDSIRRLEDAGARAVVMYSLFEEQITFDSFLCRLLFDEWHKQLRRIPKLLS
jgi:dihydroorotate dehydrogenase (fumarate)